MKKFIYGLLIIVMSTSLKGTENSLVQDFTALIRGGKNPHEVLNQEIAQNKFLVVKCTMERCAPCKRVAPQIAEMANHYKGRVRFIEINISLFDDVVSPYNIRSAPSFIIFAHGKFVKTIGGSDKVKEISKELDTQLSFTGSRAQAA